MTGTREVEPQQLPRRRLVFISNMAAPYQIRFCEALQKYFDAEFWFHVHVEPNRPAWWRVPLGPKCRILPRVRFKQSRRYFAPAVLSELHRFDPAIVLLGGFTYPTCLLAYWWSRWRGRTAVLLTEVYRGRGRPIVRRRGLFTQLVHWLYRNLDGVLAVSAEAATQFRDDFEFGRRVREVHYAADIDAHLGHPLRRHGPPYTYLFANRLVEIYDPLAALDIFAAIVRQRPDARLLMNASGELRGACEQKVRDLHLESAVEFLDTIERWTDLHAVYRRADILILPARFSAGNFTVIEAMASGMGLVVSRRVLGTGEALIQHGHNGFLAEPEVGEFVRWALEYERQPGLLTRHGAINKQRAIRYSPGVTAAVFNEALRQLAHRGAAPQEDEGGNPHTQCQ